MLHERYHATVKRELEASFECSACGAYGGVRLRAVGRSGPVDGRIFVHDDEEAAEQATALAHLDLSDDVKSVLATVACRACGHRNRKRLALRFLGPGLLGLAALLLVRFRHGSGTLLLGGLLLGGIALYLLYLELSVLARARAAVFVRFRVGKVPERAQPTAESPPAASPTAAVAPVLRAPASGVYREPAPREQEAAVPFFPLPSSVPAAPTER